MDITYSQCYEYDIFRREQARVKDWTFRCMLEAQCHSQVCVLTLTYNDEHLPGFGNVSVRDFQLFMKSLRDRIKPVKVRFFGCGEYGSKGSRPHYHVIIFGYIPQDLVYHHSDKHGIKFYLSQEIADIWKRGYILVCPTLDEHVIPYVCKYLQKFNEKDLVVVSDCGRYAVRLTRPFVLMSRRPGIGYNAIHTGLVDLNTDKVYCAGKSVRIPRYYLNKLEEEQLSRGFWFNDFDGSLYHSTDLLPMERELCAPLTQIDFIRKKRRVFWSTRFDSDKYVNNVLKFMTFKNERDKT